MRSRVEWSGMQRTTLTAGWWEQDHLDHLLVHCRVGCSKEMGSGAQPDGENKIIAHWRMDCLSCSRSTALGVSFFIIIFQPLAPFSWIPRFAWYDFGSCEILYSFWKDKKQHGPWWGLSFHLNWSFRNLKHSQHRHSVKNSDLSHFKDSAIPHQWISIHLPLRSNLESWN